MNKLSTYQEAFEVFKQKTGEKQLLKQLFKACLKPAPASKILDVGCANSHIASYLQPDPTKVTLIDIIEQPTSEPVNYVQGRFEDVDLPEKYDIVLASHVWGHFYHNQTQDLVLEKILRSLTDEGKAVICYNTNRGFMGEFTSFMTCLSAESQFDYFTLNMHNCDLHAEKNFFVTLRADSFDELADLSRILYVDDDKSYDIQFPAVKSFLEERLYLPELVIEQKMLVLGGKR